MLVVLASQLSLASPPQLTADLEERAQTAYRNRQFEDAVTLYKDLVRVRPMWAEGWGYLASSLFELKRYDEARDAYRQTTRLTPKNGASWAFLGFCQYELKDYQEAFASLRKAEALVATDDQQLTAKVKYHMAVLWDTAGQFQMAGREIGWLVDHNIDAAPVVAEAGLVALRSPDFPESLAADKREFVMKVGRAAWAANAHHLDEARRQYEALLAEYPMQQGLHYTFGLFLVQLDQQAALQQYQEELRLTSRHVPARIEAAYLCLVMGKLSEGLSFARRAVELEPRNAAAHNIKGRIEMELKQTAVGTRDLAEAVRLAPGDATFHLHLAQAYQRTGNKVLATKEFATFDQLKKTGNAGDDHPY